MFLIRKRLVCAMVGALRSARSIKHYFWCCKFSMIFGILALWFWFFTWAETKQHSSVFSNQHNHVWSLQNSQICIEDEIGHSTTVCRAAFSWRKRSQKVWGGRYGCGTALWYDQDCIISRHLDMSPVLRALSALKLISSHAVFQMSHLHGDWKLYKLFQHFYFRI